MPAAWSSNRPCGLVCAQPRGEIHQRVLVTQLARAALGEVLLAAPAPSFGMRESGLHSYPLVSRE